MKISSPAFSVDAAALLHKLAILAMAVGVGVWGAVIFAPVPGEQPPALEVGVAPSRDTAAVSRWFGGAALRVRVTVVGLIAGDKGGGAALLALNGAAPQAYRVGQVLAPGVTLAAVGPNAVSIDQDGVIEQVDMPAHPVDPVEGFISVPATARRP